MIYICIPARDEDRTIGVLLWRIRETMASLARDYEVLALDDGSRDGTRELVEKYKRVMPLTLIPRDQPGGYGPAVERLLREAVDRARYPKRDAIAVVQADFTDPPEHLAVLAKALEGGADIVASAPAGLDSASWPARLGRKLANLALGKRRRLALGAGDPLCGFRIYRVMVAKRALDASRGPLLRCRDPWAANVELLAKLAPFARRLAAAPVQLRNPRRRKSWARHLSSVRELLRIRRVAVAVAFWSSLGLGSLPGGVRGQDFVRDTLSASVPAPARIPFSVGEKLRYKVKFGFFNVGEGWMSVPRIDTISGFPTYAAEWRIKGGVPFYKMDSKFYSWMDVHTLVSRRFVKDQHEGGRKRYKEFMFFPEERRFQRIDYDTAGVMPTSLPLDDVAFVYFVRTLLLNVGDTLMYNRFYKEEGNPVIIRVLRKDQRKVGAGKFNTIVVQPVIRTDGLFAEGGRAEIHFSDDEHRLLVYMETNIAGNISLSLHLEEILSDTSVTGASAGGGGQR